jgi:glycosyltransferase involved in cell wall biosynthesis
MIRGERSAARRAEAFVRILQINSARTLGGGERHFTDLAGALAARGHEVFAALRPGSPLRDKLANIPGANVSELPLRNAIDLPSARGLARLAREHRIEIIHAHLARDYPVAALAARGSPGARLVLTRHVPFALNRLHRLTLANVGRVICVSEGVARKLRESRVFPAGRIRVVPNGVGFARYDAALAGFDRGAHRAKLHPTARLLVGTVGELSETKGQEDFVRAAAIVARRNERAAFLVAGEDNSPRRETRRRLEQLIADENLAGRVRLLSYVADLVPFLAALDIYVSPSRAEAFGLATVEAMACGACVVATATDGTREIVADGETGRVAPVGNIQALADAINELLDDEAARRRLAARGRAHARESFGLARMIDATEAVYREALAERGARR